MDDFLVYRLMAKNGGWGYNNAAFESWIGHLLSYFEPQLPHLSNSSAYFTECLERLNRIMYRKYLACYSTNDSFRFLSVT